MKRFLVLIPIVVTAISLHGESRRETPLVVGAMSRDARVADAAIAALRERGPRGVQLMLHSAPQDVARYRAALDRVCQQRDCYTSQLYWYTDLDRAKAAAKASGKPILSLHLLGDLSEELSCANSRLFRTTLYSSPTIADYMRANFILHWKSVRPVPKITVDFGDGRRIRQTITGNSIHYLLDEQGKPLDALPGLYSPERFLSHLQAFANLAHQYARSQAHLKNKVLLVYHNARWRSIANELGGELGRVRSSKDRAASRAATKARMERPLLSAFDIGSNPISDPEWKRIASGRDLNVEFDIAALKLIRAKAPSSATFDVMVRNLEESVKEDTVRNEFDFHRRIHEWMMNEPIQDLETLNERVYAELFLTPSSDPWLGLVQDEVFTAIQNAGIEGGS